MFSCPDIPWSGESWGKFLNSLKWLIRCSLESGEFPEVVNSLYQTLKKCYEINYGCSPPVALINSTICWNTKYVEKYVALQISNSYYYGQDILERKELGINLMINFTYLYFNKLCCCLIILQLGNTKCVFYNIYSKTTTTKQSIAIIHLILR